MKSDLTRLTFKQNKHYRAVQQQQGRVQLDADWNEQNDITGHRVETETVDVVGKCGAPLHADGFRFVAAAAGLTADEAARPGNKNPPAVAAGDLLLTAGRFYARGVLAENDTICLVSAQPDLPTPAQLTKLGVATTFPPKAAGTYLAYLDAWPRLRTAIDDPQIREVALGGPDTATRIKNAWQVKFLAAAAGDDCASNNGNWDALLNPKPGTLAASVATTASKPGPCIVDPGSGYRRLENQLYRVEIHTGGDSLAKTTFKWSRDNGAIVTRWISKKPLSDELEVESTGRDKVLNIAPGHWVELSDDTHEELGLPGTFALVTKVSGNIVTIDSASATGPVEIASFPKNPKVRRWDSAPAKPGKWIAPDGEKTLNSVAKFELEDGVVVQFGTGTFRTGDYWLIPARTALPFVEWPAVAGVPVAQPPHGVEHHYCKLAVVELKAGAFTIKDCRPLFPPLTELTSLFYVSGESQEATPDPTKPAATLLPLALPLKVGVANGGWPVVGARVRFKIQAGAGTLTPATGIVVTAADGVASCAWSLDSGMANQQVIAELLDDADARVHLPIIFHARLNTAKLVSYDPAKCEGMKNAAPPVVTVQDALDFLCHEKSGVECCVTIGKLGDRPGDYETVAAAVADLLEKRRNSAICLTLLPGDHLIDKELIIKPADQKSPLYFKIDGCSHASRLVLKALVGFKNVQAIVLRQISISMEGGGLHVNDSDEIEVSACLISGRPAKSAALIQIGHTGRVAFFDNQVRAVGEAKPASPSNLFIEVPELARTFALVDDRDFSIAAMRMAEALATRPLSERKKLAKTFTAAAKKKASNLSAAEKAKNTAMLRTLATDRLTARTLANRLIAVRDASLAAGEPAGLALALLDFDAVAALVDNQIDGQISLGALPATKLLNKDELEGIAKMIEGRAILFTEARGRLQVRGNRLLQLLADDESISAMRGALKAQKKVAVPVWASGHFTDNIVVKSSNHFIAHHLSLTNTRFLELQEDLGAAFAHTATYVGNSADTFGKTALSLFSRTNLAPAQAANQGLNIVVL